MAQEPNIKNQYLLKIISKERASSFGHEFSPHMVRVFYVSWIYDGMTFFAMPNPLMECTLVFAISKSNHHSQNYADTILADFA